MFSKLIILLLFVQIQSAVALTFRERCDALDKSLYYRSSCHVYHTTVTKTWQDAFDACTDMTEKGYLATILGEGMRDVINTFLFTTFGSTAWTWVGTFRKNTTGNVKDGWYYIGPNGQELAAPKGKLGGWRGNQPTTASYHGGCFYAMANNATGGVQERHVTAATHKARFLCQYDDLGGGGGNGGRKFGEIARNQKANDTSVELEIREGVSHRLGCAEYCTINTQCRSFAHSNNDQKCILYFVYGEDLGLIGDGDYWVFNRK